MHVSQEECCENLYNADGGILEASQYGRLDVLTGLKRQVQLLRYTDPANSFVKGQDNRPISNNHYKIDLYLVAKSERLVNIYV